MSLLRRTRAEVAGAIRSLRYDLGKHPVEPPAGGPDMTSTGMSTFGGFPVEEQSSRYEARRPPPRKVLAVSTIGLLTVAGAAGAYLAVVNGLGALTSEPAAADAFPERPTATSNAELGAGPVSGPETGPGTRSTSGPGRIAAATTITADGRIVAIGEVPPAPRPPAAAGAAAPPAPATKNASPTRTTIPTSPECKCDPPVPTPTAPTGSPSPTASTAPTSPSGPASSEPAPGGSSATPDESAEPSSSPQARRHRHRH